MPMLRSSLTACIVCGYLHPVVPRGVSSLGSGDIITSRKNLTPDFLSRAAAIPPNASAARPPFRCAWERAAPTHQHGIHTSAQVIADSRGGTAPYGLLTQRYVGLLVLDDPEKFNARLVWVGLVDDGVEPVRLLIGAGRLVHSGFLGREWRAKSLVAVPTEIAPGSREGVDRAIKAAVHGALQRLTS